jgi:hypothetical protein
MPAVAQSPPQPLGHPGDHADLAIHPAHTSTSWAAAVMTRSNSLCPLIAKSSGRDTRGSCSASATNQPSHPLAAGALTMAPKSSDPSPGTVNAPVNTASRKLLRLRSHPSSTACRMSLVWRWVIRCQWVSMARRVSPPTMAMWPASNSSVNRPGFTKGWLGECGHGLGPHPPHRRIEG